MSLRVLTALLLSRAVKQQQQPPVLSRPNSITAQGRDGVPTQPAKAAASDSTATAGSAPLSQSQSGGGSSQALPLLSRGDSKSSLQPDSLRGVANTSKSGAPLSRDLQPSGSAAQNPAATAAAITRGIPPLGRSPSRTAARIKALHEIDEELHQLSMSHEGSFALAASLCFVIVCWP